MSAGTFWLERAATPAGIVAGLRVAHEAGVIREVAAGAREPGDVPLRGLALPGFANAHSHAFHRVLRGRTHAEGGTFWTWREAMYRAAGALDPERYRRLAAAVFAEMTLAGYTAVGEFHYLHRAPDGSPYRPAGAMAEALVAAAADAGIRLTLLDALYLRGGLDEHGAPLAPTAEQRRFVDVDVAAWAERHRAIAEGPRVRRGAAIHSLRAVPPDAVPALLAAIGDEPLHAHVSEQPAENAQLLAAHGATPVALLEAAGALTARFTAVHATHLTEGDIRSLAAGGSAVCVCPTTERDLADGIGPAGPLRDAGVPLSVGSDQHAVVDPFDELRALEGHERLRTGRRGAFTPRELLAAGTETGYRGLGWRGGRIEPGTVCDLVSVDTRSVRTAGADPGQLWLAAAAADVTDVVVGGELVVQDRRHRMGDVGGLLADAIEEVRG